MDLKTDYILVTRDGSVAITDFGLSGYEEDLRASPRLSGTPGYVAP
ncbi:hypothetical protein SmJEL517_g04611 [Synchytrium microbalum]|uniref:Protein kinase domain-containing protein n=1 Tax=Synchytrium microbalum TaxID=1806994 RepID=A0A507C268_9FUNG|nr:uncharacterized protein SmJEL517_g04611 [Synchytrium microbalum]TPX32184.1 hypothetical protein SmJEL517_g04611 [Synchytrium microbalum]